MDKNKKETAPEVPVQEQPDSFLFSNKTINQMRIDYGLEPIENGDVVLCKYTNHKLP